MPASETLTALALVAVAAACVAGTWGFIEIARTMRSARAFSDDARKRVVPLLDKADVTIDAVNAELLRIDAIITRFEDASERVSSASGTIHDIVNAPTDLVSGMALRVRKAWRGRHQGPSATVAGQESVAPAGPAGKYEGETNLPTPLEGER